LDRRLKSLRPRERHERREPKARGGRVPGTFLIAKRFAQSESKTGSIVASVSDVSHPESAPAFPPGGGEMGALIREIDWSKTPLGAIDTWSLALRMMVSFLLANRFPLLLWWGAQYVQIYNDAYRPIPGTKHPK